MAVKTFNINEIAVETAEEHSFKEFLLAVEAGNIDVMSSFLQARPLDINLQDSKFGVTALHVAAQAGNITSLEFLMADRGADLTILTKDGWSPLHYGADDLKTLSHLLPEGTKPEIINIANPEDGITAAHLAADNEKPYMYNFLVSMGADIDVKMWNNGYSASEIHRIYNPPKIKDPAATDDNSKFFVATAGELKIGDEILPNTPLEAEMPSVSPQRPSIDAGKFFASAKR